MESLDGVYDNLLDLVRSDWEIPALALDAVITCAGMIGNTDRAFATFAEYDELFGLTRDVTAYNALLEGASYRGRNSVETLFNIVERMEEDGLQPDGNSFSIIFTCIAPGIRRIPPTEIHAMLDMMEEKGVNPLPFTIARLAQLLRNTDHAETQELVDRMDEKVRNLTGNDPVEVKNERFDAITGCYRNLLVFQCRPEEEES
jgi:hypothetical protein